MRISALGIAVANALLASAFVGPAAADTNPPSTSGASCESDVAIIDNDFPTGAFARCEVIGQKQFKLIIAPEDEGNINCSAWYAFRVTPRKSTRITVELDYTKCGHRYWPKSSTDGRNWDYLPERYVTVEGERGERTATIKLKAGKRAQFIAAQEILPPSVYDAWLDSQEGKPITERRLLGKSAHQRDIEMLTIADPDFAQRETVVLVGRQHPPEVTGALAMFPFMETLMGDSELAKAYRARFETITVPLLNPDGVVYGHWRHNTGGVDLNRDWGPFTQPETQLMNRVLRQIEADPNRKLRLLLDFHSTNRDVFYTIPDELPTDPPLFTKNWLERYQERMTGYEVDRDARHTVGRPISKAHTFDIYGAPAITFEIGDETDRKLITRIGREAAIAMMETLLKTVPPAPAQANQEPPETTIISGGLIYDGSGEDGKQVDIAISGETIAYIGDDALARFPEARLIDASGLIVAPGFIDPHTHAGSDLASDDRERRANLAFGFQGVTTVVIGNDGFGYPGIYEMATAAQNLGVGTNVAFLAGLGPIRESVLGKADIAPDDAQLDRMKGLTRSAMCEGAYGFSAGLYYVPQNYATTEEVIALARVAGELGGYYDTHMRDESTYNISVTGALRETLRIGREANIPVHIAHVKALGPAVWGHSAQMIEMINTARADGQRVTADQYPWTASGTRISNALVPRWALEGGLDQLRLRLADSETLHRIKTEMVQALERRGGAGRLLVTGQVGEATAPIGKTLAEIAEQRGTTAIEAAIHILRDGDARVASFNMSPDDITAFAVQEWVVTGSDGSTGHPRKYASFPKAYRDLVTDGEAMSLARFVRRSTGLTADIIGLDRRGYLRPGYFADIVVFDPEQFSPQATYQDPRVLAQGVRHLWVNGEPLISDAAYSGRLPGQALLKQTDCGSPREQSVN